jgi:hypothetical protein
MPPLVDFRAPCLWIFLSSLQEASFSSLLEHIRDHAKVMKTTSKKIDQAERRLLEVKR